MKKTGIEKQVDELKSQLDALSQALPENKIALILFSGDLDRVLAAFIIATGASAMGMDVVMFFTFWGTPVLRDKKRRVGGKDFMGKMFGTMLPKGTDGVKLSKMNMCGMGTAMMKSLMKKRIWPPLIKCWISPKNWESGSSSVRCPWTSWDSRERR